MWRQKRPALGKLVAKSTQVKQVFLEAVLVGLVGATLAFGANALSPRGLKLTPNFFPGDGQKRNLPPSPAGVGAGTNGETVSATNSLAERLKAQGLGLVDIGKAMELFRDPRYQQGLVVFLDARGDREFQEGHIPGAHQFDHFHFDKFLTTIIPLCQAARQIVVYCGGGCELSEHAATMLGNDLGIPKEKLFVYGGGITEWKSKGMPIEVGDRKENR